MRDVSPVREQPEDEEPAQHHQDRRLDPPLSDQQLSPIRTIHRRSSPLHVTAFGGLCEAHALRSSDDVHRERAVCARAGDWSERAILGPVSGPDREGAGRAL